jgi:Rad3-related DNA helicase
MKKDILEYFPLDSEPRPKQVEALQWLQKQTAKYILLEAPVGVGKSAIGVCYSRWLSEGNGSSYILTPQRILQEQYEQSFDASLLATLYGKGNYTCSGKNTTCDIGSLVKPRCDSCPFGIAMGKAVKSPNTVFNYKLALLLYSFTPIFNPEKHCRKLMVLDECHTVEEHLVEFNAVTVVKNRCDKFDIKFPDMSKHNLFTAFEWMKTTYLPAAQTYLTNMFHEVEPLLDKGGNELTRREVKLIREYSKLESHVDEICEFTFTSSDILKQEYVLVFDQQMFKYKQVTGARNFHEILDPQADTFLFMSSTILNKDGFCKDLGLPPEDTAFLSLDSEFPIENRPVMYMPQMKMNAAWVRDENTDDRKKMVKQVKSIANFHEGESGIIHTANFAIAKWLVQELDGKCNHQILHHNPDCGDDRNSIIRQFTGIHKPSILISPSITEGLDLYDDLARFAMFVKVPFGYMGDQWIKRRMQISSEWYQLGIFVQYDEDSHSSMVEGRL